jgi:uncharacterized membrane protein
VARVCQWMLIGGLIGMLVCFLLIVCGHDGAFLVFLNWSRCEGD